MREKACYIWKALQMFLILFLITLMSGSEGEDILILTTYNKNLSKMMDVTTQLAYATDLEEEVYVPLETFQGVLTGYGYDCVGCSGITSSGYDIRNGNIYYQDPEYGQIRIIAADRKYPFGTIMRISENEKSIIAIVLDRGGAIYTGNVDADLVVSSESVAVQEVGKWQNATFEVLRYGY